MTEIKGSVRGPRGPKNGSGMEWVSRYPFDLYGYQSTCGAHTKDRLQALCVEILYYSILVG